MENNIIIEQGTNLEDLEKGSPEYEQAMINKAENGTIYTNNDNNYNIDNNNDNNNDNNYDNNDNNNDNNYAGKYKTVEELEKAYKELQKKLGQNNSNDTVNNQTTQNNQDNNQTTQDNNQTTQDNNQTTQNNQDNVQDPYKQLGLTKEQFEEQQNIIKEYKRKEQLDIFGGEEKYNEMISWGENNLNDYEKSTFDKLISTGDINDLKFASEFITNKYNNLNNSVEPLRGTSINSKSESYESIQQLIADQKKPEYKNDPAFRNYVMNKLSNSNI